MSVARLNSAVNRTHLFVPIRVLVLAQQRRRRAGLP
jgi:hypothetical protein